MARKQKVNKAICNRFKKQRERDNIPRGKKQTKITNFFQSQNDANISIEAETIGARTGDEMIEFFQINNQKRIMSNKEITRLAQGTKAFCILGQEPSTYGFNITGLNTRHTIIQAAVDRPRAYISCHKLLNAWPVENLCSRDVATAIIDANMDSGKFLVVSLYWDGRIDEFPREASLAMKMAREKDYTLVLGGDSNARNDLFGSDKTEKRGRIIEDLMVEYDLEVANKGKTPTCVASHQGSVIDITLVSGEKADLIKNGE